MPDERSLPEDWSFPDVASGAAPIVWEDAPVVTSSVREPASEPGAPDPLLVRPAVDTGSDAWWRMQAVADHNEQERQRAAALAAGIPADPGHVVAPPLSEPPPATTAPRATAVVSPPLAPSVLWPSPTAQASAIPPDAPVPHAAEGDHWAGYAEDDDGDDPTAERTIRRRRPAQAGPVRALAGASVAVAGVLLGIGALLWANAGPQGTPTVATGSNTQITPPASAPAPRQSAPAPTSTHPMPAGGVAPPRPVTPVIVPAANPVTVLNNSRVFHLADGVARRLRAAGWPVSATGNAPGRFSVTTLYYLPGQQAVAAAFVARFGGIGRTAVRPPGLPGRGLTLVLTRDYSGPR